MLVRSIQFPMVRFLKDVTLRVYLITALSVLLPLIAYNLIDIVLLRFLTVCILSVISTLGLGYYLGFNKADRMTIRIKVVSIVKNKILKR